MDRVILHSDMNSCYASIEILHHPQLRNRPVAVGGDPESRHGIVLAKNPLAKAAGVKTGMALWEARQCCPEIVFVPPHYDQYLRFSRLTREIYADYTDHCEPFGIDEAWLDVTDCVGAGSGRAVAEEIRRRIRQELGVTVSVGVSWNKIYAKFGSDYRKPDAVTCITRDNYRDIVWKAPAEDLLFVGRATKRKLLHYGISTIGELAEADPDFLRATFGKVGQILKVFASGEDATPVAPTGQRAPIKSIGNGTTTPRDLVDREDVRAVVLLLSESVSARLRDNGFRCRTVELSIRDKDLCGFTRQTRLPRPTDITEEIAGAALALFAENYSWQRPVRSLTVRGSSLESAALPDQPDLLTDENRRQKREKLDRTLDRIRRQYGYGSIQRGPVLLRPDLAGLDARSENIIHPMGYFQNGNHAVTGDGRR